MIQHNTFSDTVVGDRYAVPCFDRLVAIERAATPASLSRAMRAVVERNGCSHGAIVLVGTCSGVPIVEAVWSDPGPPKTVVAVATALRPMLDASSDTDEILGPWAPAHRMLSAEAIERVTSLWGAPYVCAVKIAGEGTVGAWLLLGGRDDDSEVTFKTRILNERAERIGLLVTALALPLRRVLDRRSPLKLSRTERDILAKLAEGMRPPAIASARGTSLSTVRNHISRVRRRLDASSDAEVVAIALRCGLL